MSWANPPTRGVGALASAPQPFIPMPRVRHQLPKPSVPRKLEKPVMPGEVHVVEVHPAEPGALLTHETSAPRTVGYSLGHLAGRDGLIGNAYRAMRWSP